MGVREAEQFVALVHGHPDISNELGGCDEEVIARAEEALGVTFPPSYRLFVRELGTCEIAGEAFSGVWVRDSDPGTIYGSVRDTLDLRATSGLPPALIAVRPDGMGGHFVLDTAAPDADGEAPVRVWEAGASKAGDELEYIGPDFGTVALQLATRAVETW